MLASNRGTDFIDSHHYLNHPSGGWHLEPGTTSQAISSILDDQNLGFFGKPANLTAYGKTGVIIGDESGADAKYLDQSVKQKAESAASAELSDIDVQIDNRYATVVVNSLDGKPIEESGSMLLTTVGHVWNRGQVTARGFVFAEKGINF